MILRKITPLRKIILEFRIHPDVVHHEGINVSHFIHRLRHRLAAAMTGVRVNPDQFRRVTRVGPLQLRRILE